MNYNSRYSPIRASSRQILEYHSKHQKTNTSSYDIMDYSQLSSSPSPSDYSFPIESYDNSSRMRNKLNYPSQTTNDNYSSFLNNFLESKSLSHSYSSSNTFKSNHPLLSSYSKYEPPCISSRKSEITNPESYYQKSNAGYWNLKRKEKEYLDFNYRLMKLHDRKRVDIKPYNKDTKSKFNRSSLHQNIIVNPMIYYDQNKYVFKKYSP